MAHPKRLGRRLLAPVLTALALSTSAAACTTTPSQASPAPRVWIVQDHALRQLLTSSLARLALSRDTVYDLMGTGPRQTTIPAVPTADFTSEVTLAYAVTHHTLPVGTRAVLYDPEHWAYTPLTEQQHVGAYLAKAALVAHQHGLTLVATPALDLVQAFGSTGGTTFWQRYLQLGIAAQAARAGADVADVQAQSLEGVPATYASFVSQAAAQIRSVRPATTVLAGLSTGPTGVTVTATTLPAAERAVAGVRIAGFWLNVPGQSSKCPLCTVAPLSTAVAAVR